MILLAESKRYPPEVFLTFTIVLLNLCWDRLIRQWSQTESMPALTSRVVKGLRVVRDTLIPDENGTSLIADTALEILSLSDVIEQKVQEVVRFLLVEPNDLLRVDGIDIFKSLSANIVFHPPEVNLHSAFSLVTG